MAIAAMAVMTAGGVLRADLITLSGEGRLSGTVRSINGDGVVELESSLADEPIFLRAEAVRKVAFGTENENEDPPSCRVELNNGDILPVEIESLDDRQLAVMSPVAGRLLIPRSSLKSLMMGIHPNKVIYPRGGSFEDMKPEGPQGDNWSFDEGAWSVQGQGRLVRKLEPTEQFSAKFNLSWNGNPSFQFHFADPLLPSAQVADRYLFQFGNGGIEVRRESSKGGRRSTTLLSLNRRPDQYPDNHLRVEIRVDRRNSMLYLFLNDEPEGRFGDPVPHPPEAGGIAFSSTAGNETHMTISGVEIAEWDHNGDRHRTEDRGDAAVDSLIERRGDRFGGSLVSIKPAPEGPLFVFKSDFQEAPIELPESEISTVFFKNSGDDPAKAFHPFALRLRGQGIIRVASCSFPGDRIEATHPLLGALVLDRREVTALERLEEKEGEP
ncbi:hypothetical protein OVA24_14715 [Luteolibacter sp. SL250]|uniref:hypothetical protein n=1 Tax=Luteolibacter sp. SL250 TaxID=2995170 RepID=UPI00226E8611|nr:hypothetical protein [Luteolibacter sp. SL250]WAC18485.1 hypothetical protein OVA24_14715 [Luteolibacter sp. SL250]